MEVVSLILKYDGLGIGHSLLANDVLTLRVSEAKGEGLSLYDLFLIGGSPAQQGHDVLVIIVPL